MTIKLKNIITYKTKDDVWQVAQSALGKTLRDFIPVEEIEGIEKKLANYATSRKGYFGELAEEFVFGLPRNAQSEADFKLAGVELKTTPIKRHPARTYIAKERLVFSMIDYRTIINETWAESSFLKKNKCILLMLYLYLCEKLIIDYKFKFVHFLDLLNDISEMDIRQIQHDWESIVTKIRNGQAHLLSEGDTFYLGACTKGAKGTQRRFQPNSTIPAKPRAFSLKQSYVNALIQRFLKKEKDLKSIHISKTTQTIEETILSKFALYLGLTDREICKRNAWKLSRKHKGYKRQLANYILTSNGASQIVELEKANITMRAITLEPNGMLRESISFPTFDYGDLCETPWYKEGDVDHDSVLADFHAQLEEKKFLFVIFQKMKGSKDIVLKKAMYWNFPAQDMAEAQRVYEKAQRCVALGRYAEMPKISESLVAHVRPHGRNALDTMLTPQGTREIKRCFWLNAKYIQKVVEGNR